ncbi:MAG: glycosyltransferase family 4 protein [Candidatus Komeilibacteria bacterium]
MAKRLLIFSLTYYPFVGGAEVAIKEIADRITDFDAVLLTAKLKPELPKEEMLGRIKVIRLGQGNIWDKYLYAFRAARRAYQLQSFQKFDLAWAMMANYAGLAAWLFRWRSRVPYVLTEQSGDSDFFIWIRVWFWLPIYRSMYKRAVRLQAISQSLARRAKKFGHRKKEIAVIPNGVDLDVFTNSFSVAQCRDFRHQLTIADEEFVVITTSRLVYKNAIDDLIKAINCARYKLGVPARLLIVGAGSDQRILEALAVKKGVAQYVAFIGQIDHREMPKYLAAADVFCRPSLSEGLGNSFLEAMAFGLPIIATPVGGIVDFLRDGETGLVCQVRQPLSIAQALQRYYCDQQLYRHIQTTGQQLVRAQYDWNTIAVAMNKLFISCLA